MSRNENTQTSQEKTPIIDVCLVNFHHARGPEVEYSVTDKKPNLFPYLPFQALPDGSHSFKQTFTYFTLLYNPVKNTSCLDATSIPDDEMHEFTTVFAISCSKQIQSEDLITKTDDVTRSTVQKACVVIATDPILGHIKEKLGMVTNVFFEQRDFNDKSILNNLYDNLCGIYSHEYVDHNTISTKPFYLGLCLRQILKDFQKNALLILKTILLEKKIVFFGNNVEKLCNLQFGFISLIPNLINHLHDCGSPLLNKNLENLTMVDHFKSSDRESIWKFLSYPLQVFGKGGVFSPYTPLQEMDDLLQNCKFFVMGTSNSLFIDNGDVPFYDLLINVDTCKIEHVNKTNLPDNVMSLTYQDKRWIEDIAYLVTSTWDDNDPFTPTNAKFEGSEDYIRNQFEDYLTSLLATAKLYDFQEKNIASDRSATTDLIGDKQLQLFNKNWAAEWMKTQNYDIFMRFTDDRIFDLFEPRHLYSEITPMSSFKGKFSGAFFKKKNSSSTIDLKQTKSEENVPKAASLEIEEKGSKPLPALPKDNETTNSSKSWNVFKGLFAKDKSSEQVNNSKPDEKDNKAASSLDKKFETDERHEHDQQDDASVESLNSYSDVLGESSTKAAIAQALTSIGLLAPEINEEMYDDFSDEYDVANEAEHDESFENIEPTKKHSLDLPPPKDKKETPNILQKIDPHEKSLKENNESRTGNALNKVARQDTNISDTDSLKNHESLTSNVVDDKIFAMEKNKTALFDNIDTVKTANVFSRNFPEAPNNSLLDSADQSSAVELPEETPENREVNLTTQISNDKKDEEYGTNFATENVEDKKDKLHKEETANSNEQHPGSPARETEEPQESEKSSCDEKTAIINESSAGKLHTQQQKVETSRQVSQGDASPSDAFDFELPTNQTVQESGNLSTNNDKNDTPKRVKSLEEPSMDDKIKKEKTASIFSEPEAFDSEAHIGSNLVDREVPNSEHVSGPEDGHDVVVTPTTSRNDLEALESSAKSVSTSRSPKKNKNKKKKNKKRKN
ncbi:hypothetical protein ACO0QE_002744 [Hanseniaspora vineae]